MSINVDGGGARKLGERLVAEVEVEELSSVTTAFFFMWENTSDLVNRYWSL